MNSLITLCLFAVLALTTGPTPAPLTDAARLRELRSKAREGSLTSEEKSELDAAMLARGQTKTPAPSKSNPAKPSVSPSPTGSRDDVKNQRQAQYEERQELSLNRMRQMGRDALSAAQARHAPSQLPHEYYVNNEAGDDNAGGLSATEAVRTLSKGVSLLKPGDTLHLAVTGQPYRETLRLGDDFGGVEGKPIVIEGHGATLTGCDPLRLDGWVEAGEPGLYKSAKFLSELEEFGDSAKLMRVFFLVDGVMQHMGRSSKGAKSHFKSPSALQAGEWTYAEADKTFYLKVRGTLAEAKIEAPYRRNGVAVRAPKVALTHVIIKDLVVCHVLNDGFNIHGTTQDFQLKNIAAYECGDDGISPHETCEVSIDGFWSVGNSTGMANGYLSVTKARNIRLEGNLGHQFMTAHAPLTEIENAIIIAIPGTQPINVTNAQDTHLKLDNVQISAPAGQKVLNVAHSRIEARHITVVGPDWENGGSINVTASVVAGSGVADLSGGAWIGSENVYAIGFDPAAQNTNCEVKKFGAEVLGNPSRPFPGAGADPSAFRIPPRPVPHPAAGRFTSLAKPGASP